MRSHSDQPSPSLDQGPAVREPLAVIGMGCRLPGGIDSPAALWRALLDRLDAIGEVPPDRWNHARFHDTNPEKSGSIRNAKGGFIEGFDQFDAEFFGYFPIAAQRIDPQQRLLLEVTHEAMEDAGLRRDQLARSRTAVFVGSFMYDYLCIQSASEQRDEIGTHTAMGTANCSLANRISYEFDLTGPSVSLDTACSASLTALHLACQSVWTGEAEMAIAGGVNLMLRPESSIMLSKGGFLNPDQHCKAFDEAANGYVRGEGVGVVFLKPLGRALADGDAIYACVRGSAANQDGYLPEGFTVPNVTSQVALLETVYHQAGIDPTSVNYVEAHGTGTPVGDPVETSALGSVLGYGRTATQPNLWIGSLKTNLGHLEGASGIAGFMKGVLTAYHNVVPPNLHFHRPNPAIPWEHYRLDVPTRPTPLRRGSQPCIVGVNSFGAGGANVHVVLQALSEQQGQPPAPDDSHDLRTRPTLYMLSAASREALQALALRHADFLTETQQFLPDIAYSAFTRRSHYPRVLAVVGESAADIQAQLRRHAEGQVDPEILTATVAFQKSPKLAFVFSGQGGQWARMGLQLMQNETVFRESMEHIDELFQSLAGWSILEQLRKEKAESKVNDTVVVQPAVMAIQISLVKLYDHYGIRPDGVVGHSIGEVAAGYAAGALTLEQSVRVIYYRSQAQNRAAGKGGMLAVGLSFEDASQLIESIPGVSIGTVNGPEMLTLSGDTQPLRQIAAMLEKREIFNRQVNVEVAYHSHHMDAIEDLMLESLADVQGISTHTPLYSTVTTHREHGEHLNADYWYRNVREPVLFTDTLDTMAYDGYDTFVEIGPHPVLVRGAEAQLQTVQQDVVVAAAMTRTEPQQTVFLQSLARLAARGCQPDTNALFGSPRQYIRMPQNPWQHRRHWYESPAAAEVRKGPFSHPFLKRQTQWVSEDGLAVWEANLDVQKFPYLRDHQVDGEILFPATGHLELAWAVASEQFRHESFFLEDLHFDSPLILPENSRHPLEVRLEVVSAEGDYRICSRAAPDGQDEANWSKHSSGRINTAHDRFHSSAVDFPELEVRFQDQELRSVAEFYDTLDAAGLAYGPKFRCIEQLQRLGLEWLACLALPDDLMHEAKRNLIHPAILDACLHVIFAEMHQQGGTDRVYLPFRIGRVRFHRKPTQRVWSHVHVTTFDEQFLCSDTRIFDDAGRLVAEIYGVTCKRLSGLGTSLTDSLYEGCYEYRWVPTDADSQLQRRIADCNSVVLIADETEAAGELETYFLAENIPTRVVGIEDRTGIEQRLADLPLDRRTLIVFAAGLGHDHRVWESLADFPAVESLLTVAQILHQREGVPRLFVVTRGAAGAPHDRQLNLGQATLHGMSRVIRNECPNIPITLIDISPTYEAMEQQRLGYELLHSRHDRDESEICLRRETRLVRQLFPVTAESAEQEAHRVEPACGGRYHAEVGVPGALDQIRFRRHWPSPPKEHEVEIAVHAAALNFKDVMNVMGLLPANSVAGGLTAGRLGLEVAGQVLKTGSSVKDLSVGDNVMARVSEGFCGRVVTPAEYVVRQPRGLTASQAAAIPLVYVTAWHSLCYLARMEPKDKVLIHSAAGGVGGAAIRLAQRVGATVFATAGTKEKRKFVREMGVNHVYDSRSLEFYSHVMEATNGSGVDIVLNSLTGRFIPQGIKCLAPFGRFIELGKVDIYRNSKLNLQRFGENIAYFVVDADRLALQKPAWHRRAMIEVAEMFDRGELQPHEIKEFPIAKLSDALRLMTRASHCGKIVVKTSETEVETLPPRHVEFRSDRSYLITGGASGLGLEVARWMVSRGARHLILVSRTGCKSSEDQSALTAMQASGANVVLSPTDITDAEAVRQLIQHTETTKHRLAGIVHGAAILDDASVPTMDMERFARVFQPKAQGAWNLHQATIAEDAELDFFLLCSSISSILGLYGQVNYAAANHFQDALAHYRRQQGLPATSLNLGVLGQYAGMSKLESDQQDIIALLESQGMFAMPLADVLGKMEAAIIQQPVQRMTARMDWPWFRMAYPHLARDSRFVEVLGDAALARAFRPQGSGLRTELMELDGKQKLESVQQKLQQRLATILAVEPDKIDVTSSIDKLGLDSLMLTELQVSIVRLLDVKLPLVKLLKGPSIATLAVDVVEQLESDVAADGLSDTEISNPSPVFALAHTEGIKILSPWLIRGQCPADADRRLICFHSMGVGASLFRSFLINPPAGYDVLAVQTPGRENRIDEPVAESVAELADLLVPQILPLFDRPVVLWGHSFGGIVAREVICRLREQHGCLPFHFLVTGTIAPHLINRWKNREVILRSVIGDNNPEYLMSLSRYVDDPELLKAILPGLRRDYPLLMSYQYQNAPPLACPITAFAARQDEVVYCDEIQEWQQHTDSHFQWHEVEGDHWFLNRNRELIGDTIKTIEVGHAFHALGCQHPR